jgi:hypothetical protein
MNKAYNDSEILHIVSILNSHAQRLSKGLHIKDVKLLIELLKEVPSNYDYNYLSRQIVGNEGYVDWIMTLGCYTEQLHSPKSQRRVLDVRISNELAANSHRIDYLMQVLLDSPIKYDGIQIYINDFIEQYSIEPNCIFINAYDFFLMCETNRDDIINRGGTYWVKVQDANTDDHELKVICSLCYNRSQIALYYQKQVIPNDFKISNRTFN